MVDAQADMSDDEHRARFWLPEMSPIGLALGEARAAAAIAAASAPPRRGVTNPRTCQPHVYVAGAGPEDPILAVPKVWSMADAHKARLELVLALEEGRLTPAGDTVAWTLDDEADKETGRFTPVKLLSTTQAVKSLRLAAGGGYAAELERYSNGTLSASLPAAVADLEEDLAIRSGHCAPPPAWMPETEDERAALVAVRQAWYAADHESSQAQQRAHAAERAALWSDLEASGETRTSGALDSELRSADARVEALAARQRAERDQRRREGKAQLREALEACQAVLEAGRAGRPISSSKAEVDFDVASLPLNLKDLGSFGWNPPASCGRGTWIRWQCPAGHHDSKFCGCKNLDCPACADEVTRQRGATAWDRTGRLAGSFGAHVLTVPLSQRRAVADAGPRAFRHATARAVLKWHRMMGYDVGGFVYIHPVGSKLVWCDCGAKPPVPLDGIPPTHCPCGKALKYVDGDDWHPHGNFLAPMIGRDIKTGRVVVVPRWMTPESLEDLARIWQDELATLTGTMGERPVVNYGYTQTVEQARHAFRYYARSFPGWKSWTSYVGGNAYGVLSNGVLMEFHGDVIRAGLRLAIELPRHPCPKCGRDMSVVSVSAGTPATGPPEHPCA